MRLRTLLATLAAGALVGSTALTAEPAEASTPPVLFGMISNWANGQEQVAHDDAEIGIHSGIIGAFFPWAAEVPTGPFTNWLSWVHSRGAVAMPSLSPPSTVTLSQIASGTQDRYLRPLAIAMRDWGNQNKDANGLAAQVMFRLFPEMNGSWETYSPGTRGQTAYQFRLAWIHVVKLFRANGASNVRFIWNPDRVFNSATPLKSLWPGASYVDWVGLDGYNWADRTHGTYYTYDLLHNSVTQLRSITSKPLIICELGSAPFSGKPYFLSHMIGGMQRLGAKGMVYFNENQERKWRIDSSSSAISGARTGLHGSNAAWFGRETAAQINHWAASGGSFG